MNYLDTLLFYAFSCSTVLVYGIGLEHSLFISHSAKRVISRFPALLLKIMITIPVLWLISSRLLGPGKLTYLMPMALILAAGTLENLLSLIPILSDKPSPGERLFFFGTLFLSITEASKLTEALMIAFSSIAAFLLVTVLMLAIRARTQETTSQRDIQGAPLALLSLGLLGVAFYAADISWWLGEALQ